MRFVGRHIEALGRLWQARIELIVSNWDATLKRAEHRATVERPCAEADSEQSVRRVERSLRRVSRFVPGATCIHRALAGQRMLARRDVNSRVVIGLRRGPEEIEGHAWIEAGEEDRVVRAFWSDDAGYSVVR